MAKILITGASRFLQENLIRKAIHYKLPYSFIGVDTVEDLALSNLYVSKNYKFYLNDISDTKLLRTIICYEKPDVVIHQPFGSIENMLLGTQSVIEACRDVPKLIYLSTNKIYGPLNQEGFAPKEEGKVLAPVDPDAAAVAAGELLITTSGLDYNILRLPDLFGPRQTTLALIPLLIKQILNENQLDITYKGTRQRDWLHTSEIFNALFFLLEKNLANQIYNVSAGWEFSDLEISQHLCNLIGKGHDHIRLLDTNLGEPLRYAADGGKLKTLGWAPKKKFRERLEAVVGWYQDNVWALK